MVRLQPSFPRRKKTEEGRRQETPSGKEAPADKKPEHPEYPEEKRVTGRNIVIVIVVAVVLIVLVLVVMWAFPYAPPGPENVLTDSQVLGELARLRDMSAHPANLEIDPGDYPRVFGTWNNLTLVEQYYCSDVCPDYGRVDLVFQGITNEQCAAAGGRSLHDLAWGGYIGCEPKVYN